MEEGKSAMNRKDTLVVGHEDNLVTYRINCLVLPCFRRCSPLQNKNFQTRPFWYLRRKISLK